MHRACLYLGHFHREGECPVAIQELERRVVTEWLPTSGYEYADGPDIEVYLSPDTKMPGLILILN